MTDQARWLEEYAQNLLGVFGTPQLVLERGEGAYVWDADGNRYLDLLAGIAVNSLGHAHPAWVAAVSEQAGTLAHVSNFFASPPQIRLAEALLDEFAAPSGSRVFFTNSGTEAMEAAFKLARRTGRGRVLALEGAFHGRTMGALSLTAKAAYRDPFAPLVPGVTHLPVGDTTALDAQLASGDVGAVVVEILQGEGGVRPLPPGYLTHVRAATSAAGALLIVDEVQTGMGRTGYPLALHSPLGEGVVPDAVALAKAIGGGFPLGALVTYGDASLLLSQGQHGSTFGGNPLACAAGLATLAVTKELYGQVREVGAGLAAGVESLGHPLIDHVRGAGLLLAIELREDVAPAAVRCALERGFILNAVAPDAIRLAPPLILTSQQADNFVRALPGILTAAKEG